MPNGTKFTLPVILIFGAMLFEKSSMLITPAPDVAILIPFGPPAVARSVIRLSVMLVHSVLLRVLSRLIPTDPAPELVSIALPLINI